MSEALLTPEILNLPYAVARRYSREGRRDYDELVSLGFLALVRASRKFDPSMVCERTDRPAVFSSYAMLCVRFAVKKHRFYYWQKAKGRPKTYSIHGKLLRKNGSESEWLEFLGRKNPSFAECDVREEVESILGRLDPEDREVLEKRYAGGMTYAEISREGVGDKRGLSKEAIRQRIERATRRAREIGEGES